MGSIAHAVDVDNEAIVDAIKTLTRLIKPLKGMGIIVDE